MWYSVLENKDIESWELAFLYVLILSEPVLYCFLGVNEQLKFVREGQSSFLSIYELKLRRITVQREVERAFLIILF